MQLACYLGWSVAGWCVQSMQLRFLNACHMQYHNLSNNGMHTSSHAHLAPHPPSDHEVCVPPVLPVPPSLQSLLAHYDDLTMVLAPYLHG
jgi:hypothetical protein